MRLIWSGPALRDLDRLYAFLATKNENAAALVVRNLVRAGLQVPDHPRKGSRLSQYAPRDVRHLIVADYDLRYEIRRGVIVVLRVWHGKEDR
jgi:plasmid stabilization system protein ParE